MNDIQKQIDLLKSKAEDAKLMEAKMIKIGRESLASSYRESWQASSAKIQELTLLLAQQVKDDIAPPLHKTPVVRGWKPVPFYCQLDIEGEKCCEDQCDHCRLYYAPLQQ